MLVVWIYILEIAFVFAYATEYNDTNEGRISHGRLARLGEFPWMVSINKFGQHVCGGAIISATAILTAAHCVNNGLPQQFNVVAGCLTWSPPKGSFAAVRMVVDIRIHEGYMTWGRNVNRDDIALLLVSPPFEFARSSGLVQPVQLPVDLEVVEGNVIVSGFGYTFRGSGAAHYLHAIQLSVIPNPDCPRPNGMFCTMAGGLLMKGICFGDSGSPIIQYIHGDPVLVGIVEGGGTMCIAPSWMSHDIHVDVASYLRWIQAQITPEYDYVPPLPGYPYDYPEYEDEQGPNFKLSNDVDVEVA